jgi:release factor glutamine methyltransferase
VTHRPVMSKTAAERRIAWQEKVYQGNLMRPKRVTLRFFSRTIVVSQNVFIPGPAKYNLLARALVREVKPNHKVLDMGTGSGVQAILAASKGAKVTAVDVNPFAVECARLNVKRNKLLSRVEVLESDLFEQVKGQFDLIIFDPPFRWTDPRDWLERASADKDYRTLRSFFSGARRYLNDGGRILMTFGTSGDIAYFRHLVKKNAFKSKRLLRSSHSGWTYFAYKLTR